MKKSIYNKNTQTYCKVCGEKTVTFWIQKDLYSIGKCSHCGFGQTLNPPSEEELQKIYEELHTIHFLYRTNTSAEIENQYRLSFIKQYLPTGATIVDFGCATGDFLSVAQDSFNMYGFDCSSSAVAYAQQRLPKLGKNRISNSLKFLQSKTLDEHNQNQQISLDAICLWDVLEHIPDPITLLQQITTMVEALNKPKYIFISTPDFGSLAAKVLRSYWAFMTPPLHLGFFEKTTFEYIFRNILKGEIISYTTRGKTVNIAFLLYKLRQMHRYLMPEKLLQIVQKSSVGRRHIYIPSNDIAYLVIRI